MDKCLQLILSLTLQQPLSYTMYIVYLYVLEAIVNKVRKLGSWEFWAWGEKQNRCMKKWLLKQPLQPRCRGLRATSMAVVPMSPVWPHLHAGRVFVHLPEIKFVNLKVHVKLSLFTWCLHWTGQSRHKHGPWLISFTKWLANWDDPRPCKCIKT